MGLPEIINFSLPLTPARVRDDLRKEGGDADWETPPTKDSYAFTAGQLAGLRRRILIRRKGSIVVRQGVKALLQLKKTSINKKAHIY